MSATNWTGLVELFRSNRVRNDNAVKSAIKRAHINQGNDFVFLNLVHNHIDIQDSDALMVASVIGYMMYTYNNHTDEKYISLGQLHRIMSLKSPTPEAVTRKLELLSNMPTVESLCRVVRTSSNVMACGKINYVSLAYDLYSFKFTEQKKKTIRHWVKAYTGYGVEL